MSTSSEGPEDDIVFDEAFVASATVKEPSAKARKGHPLTRRLAERRRRKAMIKQWRAPKYRRSRRPSGRTVTVLLVVGLVALAAVLAQSDPLDMQRRPPARATLMPAPSAVPGDPFAGSPAVSYADGLAGINFPAARATAGFSSKEVEVLLSRTRALVAASHLDPRTLFDGDTQAFAAQLDPDQRKDFIRSLRSQNPKKSLRPWLMSFAPKTAELTGPVIKVQGETTLSGATRQGHRGVLAKVNCIFVYPVHRPERPDTTIRVVAHLTGEVFHSRDARGGWTWIYRWGSSNANSRCDAKDGYVHPFFRDSPSDQVKHSGLPVDPYDLTENGGTGDGCQTVSRI